MLFSHFITPPGNIRDACGKWGCGDHGACVNNVCVCRDFWIGDNCHIPPPLPPTDTCGNWGVQLSVPQRGHPGYAKTCDCGESRMSGKHCEIECTNDLDCNNGTCDTSVSRCVCNPDWGDVQCRRALTSSCNDNSDCFSGTCVANKCTCPDTRAGLKCEFELQGSAESCVKHTDCAGYTDTCIPVVDPNDRPCARTGCTTDFMGQMCASSGEACMSDSDCFKECIGGLCLKDAQNVREKYSFLCDSLVPTFSNIEKTTLDTAAQIEINKLNETPISSAGDALCNSAIATIIDQLLSPNGIKQLLLEEAVEEVLHYTAKLVYKSAVYAASRITASSTGKILAKIATKTVSKSVQRALIGKAISRVMKLGSTGIGALYSMFEIVGLVLDVYDKDGYNMQIPQNMLDQYMRAIVSAMNEQIAAAGGHFPREFLPSDTLAVRAYFLGDPVQDRLTELSNAYLSRLVYNSNGERISDAVASVTTVLTPVVKRPPVQWWVWVIAGLAAVIAVVLIIVISIGKKK